MHDLYPSADDNATVWESLSTHIGQASVRRLGLSNIDKSHLDYIYALHDHHPDTHARPVVVQNRFHQGNDYDAEVRAVCKTKRITYQTYGVRANSNMLNHGSSIVSVANMANVSREAALYGMIMNALGSMADDKVSLDVQVVVGTSKTARMAVLKEVQQVLMDLNDAHWWTVARPEQQPDSELGHDKDGILTHDRQKTKSLQGITSSPPSTVADFGARLEGDVYRLARHLFLEALRTED